MISYCIASFRPQYSSLLIQDLLRKTTTPFEILIWLNVDDAEFERFLEAQQSAGAPLRIVGKTTENIGMQAYAQLFQRAHYELIVQSEEHTSELLSHSFHSSAVFCLKKKTTS